MKTLKEMRERVGQISDRLGQLGNVENFTDEVTKEINDLHAEFSDLKNKIESLEKIEAVTQSTGPGRQVSPATNQVTQPQVTVGVNRADLDKKGGFHNAGEFFKAVVKSVRTGDHDARFKNAAFEKNGEDGGFLIPEDFRQEIQKKVSSDESLLSRTRQFQTAGNHLVLPTNETAPWDGNGIQAKWEEEGGTYVESKPKFSQKSLRLHKLTALVPVSEELLDDAPALQSWINMSAPEAIMHKVNKAIIAGDGAGKPLGILQSGFTATVAKESGQAADSIVYKNLVKMDSRLIGNGVWIAHAGAKEQLRQLKDDAGNHIYMNGAAFPNMSAQPYEILLGKPVIWMMGAMPAVGDRGDIILANMSYYITALKTAGIKSQVSTHVYFDRDLAAFKFSFRVAGQCPYNSPVTTENGGYEMSGFVTLADRA